jgi:hypothetical protein
MSGLAQKEKNDEDKCEVIFNQNLLCVFRNPTFAPQLTGTKSAFAKVSKDSVAQLVEQYTFNVWVLGSNPSGITTQILSRSNATLSGFLVLIASDIAATSSLTNKSFHLRMN